MAPSQLEITFYFHVFHRNITASTLQRIQGYQRPSGECAAVQTSSGRPQLWSHLLPSSLPSCRGERSALNESRDREWRGGGSLVMAEIKGIRESCAHGSQKHRCTLLISSALPCFLPWLSAPFFLPLWLWNDSPLLNSRSLTSSMGPTCSTRGDPRAALEHAVITTFTNDCWVIPVYSHALPSVHKHCSLHQPSRTAIKQYCA